MNQTTGTRKRTLIVNTALVGLLGLCSTPAFAKCANIINAATGNENWTLRTLGNQIIDVNDDECRLAAVNWSGFESNTRVVHGLWARNWRALMREIKSRGFNAIRIPFALDSLVWHTRTSTGVPHLVTTPPSGIVYNLKDDGTGGKGASFGNQEFCNEKPSVTGTCSKPKYPAQILDLHLLNAGAGRYDAKDDTSDEANRNPTSKPYPVWFLPDGSCTAATPCGPPSDPNTNLEASFTEARTINTWENIAEKFKSFRAIVGADLYNEPFGFEGHNINGDSLTEPWACWPGGGTVCNTGKARNWPAAAERIAEKILTATSNRWLIFVEGVQHTPNLTQDPSLSSYSGPFFKWGSNLYNVRFRRVNLPVSNKLVYSAHDYPNGVSCEAWLRGILWDGSSCSNMDSPLNQNFIAKLPEVWDRYWGSLGRCIAGHVIRTQMMELMTQ
jgi:aryl-phospho-beta-D-glucosidase BglC (GH1 family)